MESTDGGEVTEVVWKMCLRCMMWREKGTECILGMMLVVIWIIFGIHKSGFFVDEYFSFLNANLSPEELTDIIESGVNVYSGRELIEMCLIRDNDERFDYREVWRNQEEDTHPPLYYAIVHTVCSFTMTRAGMIAIGIGINLVTALLIYIALLKLAGLLVESRPMSAAYAFLYCASFSFVNCFLFVRMYLLMMLFSILLLYVLCRYIPQETYPKIFYAKLSAVICAGMLTHYYFWIYLAFSCLAVCVYLVYCRRFKNLMRGILAVGIAAACACLIFPKSIHQVLVGDRGSQAVENMLASDFTSRVVSMLGIVNEQVFGNCMYIIWTCILLMFLAAACLRKKMEPDIKYVLILAPAALSFLVISKVAAYITDRYIMALMPSFFLGSFLLLRRLLLNIWKNKKSELLILSVIAVSMFMAYRVPLPFMVEYVAQFRELINNQGKNAEYIYLYDEGLEWRAQCNLLEMENLNEITFYPHTDYLYYCTDFSQYDTLVLYNSMALDDDEIKAIAETAAEKGQYTECDYLFSSGYSTTYVLKR